MSNEQGKVNSLEIITMPYRTSYYCNCDFIERYVSMRGLELLVTYSDGNTETLSAEYTETHRTVMEIRYTGIRIVNGWKRRENMKFFLL